MLRIIGSPSSQPIDATTPAPLLLPQVCQVMDECLMTHLDVFFHRHAAVAIACGIYVVAKAR
jgi:hypothetical protein